MHLVLYKIEREPLNVSICTSYSLVVRIVVTEYSIHRSRAQEPLIQVVQERLKGKVSAYMQSYAIQTYLRVLKIVPAPRSISIRIAMI